MTPKPPFKRTMTQPGLGIDDGLPRLESAELEKVSDGGRDPARESKPDGAFTPPPSSRARLPREEEDSPPESSPRSDRFASAPKEGTSKRRSVPCAPPATRQQTVVGLGSKTHPQKHTQSGSSQAQSGSSQAQSGSSQAQSGPARRAPDPTFGSRPPASKPRWQEEAPSGARSRKPLTVDSVGEAATRIARNTRQTAPKVIASQSVIASAPIDSRSAFVLSLVDGASDVPGIVDAAGMPSDEVIGILARLARLGLISVP